MDARSALSTMSAHLDPRDDASNLRRRCARNSFRRRGRPITSLAVLGLPEEVVRHRRRERSRVDQPDGRCPGARPVHGLAGFGAPPHELADRALAAARARVAKSEETLVDIERATAARRTTEACRTMRRWSISPATRLI